MNFIKGFVDGFFPTDLDGNSVKSRYSYDPDDPDNDSEGFNRSDLSQNRNFSNDNVHISNSVSQLSELYRNERDNFVNGLVVRYGEGCVQQLSQLLKSNYDTILFLSHQYQNNLLALKELSNKVESAATEHLKLKNENNNLSQQLNQLTSENFNLKSQLTHANIKIKSNENHISSLNEVLRDNKNTFENMKHRCGEFYKFKSEIEDLKKKLSLAESHVTMLKKERDEFWLDPNRVLNDEDYKRRISQAFERQDRAIAVAKVMASQTPNQLKPEKDEFSDLNSKQLENESLNELKLQVDRLEDENSHLKEINDSLHTMYADLNKNLKEVKTSYLKDSVNSLASLFPTRTNPIQLVFIQPTGVLDLDIDPSTLHKYSHTSQTQSHQHNDYQQTQPMEQPTSHSHSQQHLHSQHLQSGSSETFHTGSYHGSQSSLQSSSHSLGYGPETDSFNSYSQPLQHGLHQSGVYVEKKEAEKKSSPKMNLRSKLIQYVTGLDGSPKSSRSSKEHNLLDLESSKKDSSSYSYNEEKEKEKYRDNLDNKYNENKVKEERQGKEKEEQNTKEVYKVEYKEREKERKEREANKFRIESLGSKNQESGVKSTSWNTDWDVFDEEVEDLDVNLEENLGEYLGKQEVDQDLLKEKEREEQKLLDPNVFKQKVLESKVFEPKVEKTPMMMPSDDSFDFILEEESKLLENNLRDDNGVNVDNTNSNTTSNTNANSNVNTIVNTNTNSNLSSDFDSRLTTNPQQVQQSSTHNPPRSSEFCDFNTHDHFDGYEYDDLLKSLRNEQGYFNTNQSNLPENQEQYNTSNTNTDNNKANTVVDNTTNNNNNTNNTSNDTSSDDLNPNNNNTNNDLNVNNNENAKTNEKTNTNDEPSSKTKKGWDMDFDDEMFEDDL